MESLDIANNVESESGTPPSFDWESLPAPDIKGWSSGAGHLQQLDEKQLWEILGLPNNAIPFFNERFDPQGQFTTRTAEGKAWFSDEKNGELLRLKWHQLVGLVRLLQNAFAGKPLMLFDDVGLGKTIQVAAFIAVICYYQEYYTVNQTYPGAFRE